MNTARTLRSLTVALTLSLAPVAAQAQESELATLRPAGPSLRLGRALRRAGRFDEAVRTLQQSAGRDPTQRAEALWEVARARFEQGVFQPARAACLALPNARGNTTDALHRHVCLARAYLVWNRVALAEREIALARAIGPSDPELALVVGDTRRLASDVEAAETGR